MGEVLGIDLRVAVCAAARRRGDGFEPCQLGQGTATAAAVDLMPVGAGAVSDAVAATGAMLSAVAARALGTRSPQDQPLDAVGVAFALTPDDGPRALAHRAATAAFGDPVLVPRPVAAAAWFLHGNSRPRGTVVAVCDVDAASVAVALVRQGPDGLELVARPAALPPVGDDVDLAAHLDRAVGLLESVTAEAGLAVSGLDTVVLVGEPDWLAQLQVQIGVATGVASVVDPQPEVAAALGAALLAAGPERRRLDAAGLALLGPGAAPHLVPPDGTGGGLGSAAGEGIGGPQGEVGSGVGALLHAPTTAGDSAGSAVGDALSGPDVDALVGPAKTPPGQGVGSSLGGSAGSPGGGGIGGLLGGIFHGKRGIAAGLLAAVVAAVVIGATVAGSSGGGGNDDLATDGPGATEPDDLSSGTDDGSSSTTGGSSTTSLPGSSTTSLPGGTDPTEPPAPGDPGAPTPTDPAPGDPTAPGTTAPPAVATTTTTAPRETTPPTVGGLVANPTSISEANGSEFCQFPTGAQATARVSDASGLASVTLSWSGAGASGSTGMSPGPASATFAGTISFGDTSLTVRQSATVTWSVTAVDKVGNKTTVSGPSLTLYGC